MDKSYYIRYRIYVQTANKSNHMYANHLCKNIDNLENNIIKDPRFHVSSRDSQIKSKLFIPDNLSDVNQKFYYLIGYFADFFDCIAVWKKSMVKGSIKPINTFYIVGYEEDLLLAYHYISKIINGMESMKVNLCNEYRRLKINARRRGASHGGLNAKVKSTRHFYRTLEKVTERLRVLIRDRGLIHTNKKKIIADHLKYNFKLDYRKYPYKYEPELHNAKAREGKFHNHRIILAF